MSGEPAVRYPMVVYPDVCTDGSFCYVAEHPDLPGCAAHGMTLTEAKERLVRAREAYLAQLRAEGLPLPQPNTTRPTMIEWVSETSSPAESSSELQQV